MVREFSEETGVMTTPEEWVQFAILNGQNNGKLYTVHVFSLFSDFVYAAARTNTDEQIEKHMALDIPVIGGTVHHLRWLIPMALDLRVEKTVVTVMNTKS